MEPDMEVMVVTVVTVVTEAVVTEAMDIQVIVDIVVNLV